jgi:hypothetical protein
MFGQKQRTPGTGGGGGTDAIFGKKRPVKPAKTDVAKLARDTESAMKATDTVQSSEKVQKQAPVQRSGCGCF